MNAKTTVNSIPMSEIIVDLDRVMSRTSIDDNTVFAYSETYLEDKSVMPPLTVFRDGDKFILADGFHRHAALTKLEAKFAECIVKDGGHRQAVLFALNANSTHGLRRSNGDKRLCAERLLDDSEWSQWANTVIAKAAGVAESFIRKIRDERNLKITNELKTKQNALKKLGMPVELLEQYNQTPVSEPKKYFHPKTGKPVYSTPKGKQEKSEEASSVIIDKSMVVAVLGQALAEVENITDANLEAFINKVKANLSQVSKGRNPLQNQDPETLVSLSN